MTLVGTTRRPPPYGRDKRSRGETPRFFHRSPDATSRVLFMYITPRRRRSAGWIPRHVNTSRGVCVVFTWRDDTRMYVLGVRVFNYIMRVRGAYVTYFASGFRPGARWVCDNNITITLLWSSDVNFLNVVYSNFGFFFFFFTPFFESVKIIKPSWRVETRINKGLIAIVVIIIIIIMFDTAGRGVG